MMHLPKILRQLIFVTLGLLLLLPIVHFMLESGTDSIVNRLLYLDGYSDGEIPVIGFLWAVFSYMFTKTLRVALKTQSGIVVISLTAMMLLACLVMVYATWCNAWYFVSCGEHSRGALIILGAFLSGLTIYSTEYVSRKNLLDK